MLAEGLEEVTGGGSGIRGAGHGVDHSHSVGPSVQEVVYPFGPDAADGDHGDRHRRGHAGQAVEAERGGQPGFGGGSKAWPDADVRGAGSDGGDCLVSVTGGGADDEGVACDRACCSDGQVVFAEVNPSCPSGQGHVQAVVDHAESRVANAALHDGGGEGYQGSIGGHFRADLYYLRSGAQRSVRQRQGVPTGPVVGDEVEAAEH